MTTFQMRGTRSRKARRLFGVCAATGIVSAVGAVGAAAQDTVLEFPSFQADEPSTAAWWEEVIATFEEEHPGVTVDFSNSPGARHSDLLATRFAARQPPPIVHMISRDFVRFAAQDWFGEIDSCFEDDTLSEFGGLQSFMEWEGETRGLLLNSYAYHLYYNEALLSEAGVEVPTTMDELVAAGQAVNDLDADAVGFSGITTSIADAFLEASMFVTGQGVDWVDDDGYNLDDPELIAAVDAYRTLLSEAPQGLGEHERNELLFNGRAAMMFDGNYFWQQIQDSAQDGVKENIGIALAPFPDQPGSVSNSLHLPADLDEETRALVCDFIATAARPEFQEAYGEAISVPPPRDGAISDALRDRFPEELDIMIQAKAEAESVLPGAQATLENYGVFSKLTADAMIELMVTDRPTEEVLSDLQAELEAEIPLN